MWSKIRLSSSLLLLLTLLASSHHATSQNLDLNNWKSQLPEIVKKVDAQRTLGNSLDINDFLIMNDTLFIAPAGTGYLFFWDEKIDSIIRIDYCHYHGYNFHRYLFNWNNTIYSLGGYGFWQYNGTLTRFDRKLGEWEIVIVEGDLPGSAFKYYGQINNKIYGIGLLLVPYYRTNANWVAASKVYCLDLKGKKWECINDFDYEPVLLDSERFHSFENVKWLVNQSFVLNKVTKKFFFIPMLLPMLNNPLKGEVPIIRGDILTATFFKDDKTFLLSYDLDQLTKEKNIFSMDLEGSWLQNNIRTIWILALVSILIISVLIYSLITLGRRKKRRFLPAEDNGVTSFIIAIKAYGKEILTIEELDGLLQIVHLTADSKKQKRHVLLKKIELAHPGLLSRERRPEDKRTFIYRRGG
jgi:hypothetical protein